MDRHFTYHEPTYETPHHPVVLPRVPALPQLGLRTQLRHYRSEDVPGDARCQPGGG